MKKLVLSAALVLGISASVLAQGTVYFDVSVNTSSSPTATANGLFWIAQGGQPTLLQTDVNATLWGGSSPTTMSALETLLLSDGTAIGDITFFGNGLFTDPGEASLSVPGVPPGSLAVPSLGYFQIAAWSGTASTYAAALAQGGNYTGETPVFQTPVGIAGAAPASLTGAPALILTVPEPGTLALAGLGAAALLIFRRRK